MERTGYHLSGSQNTETDDCYWKSQINSTSQVFFRGHYVFRTLNGAMAASVSFLTSAIFAALAAYVPNLRGVRVDLLLNVVRAGFVLGAIVFGAICVRVLWGLIRSHRIQVEINEYGIISGNRFWPWAEVGSVTGTRYSNGVSLGFIPRGTMIALGAGELPTTPLLTDQQYVELAQELSCYISTRFPHVNVAMQPLEPLGD
jgi:MFS family permease